MEALFIFVGRQRHGFDCKLFFWGSGTTGEGSKFESFRSLLCFRVLVVCLPLVLLFRRKGNNCSPSFCPPSPPDRLLPIFQAKVGQPHIFASVSARGPETPSCAPKGVKRMSNRCFTLPPSPAFGGCFVVRAQRVLGNRGLSVEHTGSGWTSFLSVSRHEKLTTFAVCGCMATSLLLILGKGMKKPTGKSFWDLV